MTRNIIFDALDHATEEKNTKVTNHGTGNLNIFQIQISKQKHHINQIHTFVITNFIIYINYFHKQFTTY